MISNVSAIIEEGRIPLISDHGFGHPASFENPEKDHVVYSNLLQALSKSLKNAPKHCLECIIGASSRHNNYPIRSIVSILIPRENHICWSSNGTIDPDVPEIILFKLAGGVCIINDIHIKPVKGIAISLFDSLISLLTFFFPLSNY